MRRMAWIVLCTALVLAAAGCGGGTQAPKYPAKPIDIVVSAAPGGGSDLSARLIAAFASKKFGVPVNVVNVPGAGQVTGMMQGLTAAPDGYTMMLEGANVSSFMFATRTDLPVKLEDRTIISMATSDFMYYVANTATGWKTPDDAIKFAKSRPAEFVWGAGAYGSTPMFTAITLFLAGGMTIDDIKKTKMVVFDKGNVQSLQAAASGDVQLAASLPSELDAILATGRVVALATTSPERTKDFPNIPTTKELGYPKATMAAWYGMSGPKGLPDYVIKAWDDLLKAGGADPEVVAEAAKIKKTWTYLSPADFKAHVTKEYEQILSVATAMGLRQ